MDLNFMSLISICMLPLTTSRAVTSCNNVTFFEVIRGENAGKQQSITPTYTVTMSVTEDKTKKPRFTTSMPSKMSESHKAATDFLLSWMSSSTTRDKKFVVTTSSTMIGMEATGPTTTATALRTQSGPTQGQDRRTSLVTSNNIPYLSTHVSVTTSLSSTIATFPKPVEDESTKARITTGDVTQSTGLYKFSVSTTDTPLTLITTATQRKAPPQTKHKNVTNHSKVAAGLIGGALVLMMVGFLVIYIKKRKLKEQQITTGAWAGQSPFLEGGADKGQVTLKFANRISLSSFLPQGLSKRLSLLQETDEELTDMTPTITFGGKNHGGTSEQELDENEVRESNCNAAACPEVKSMADATETIENLSCSETCNPISTNDSYTQLGAVGNTLGTQQ